MTYIIYVWHKKEKPLVWLHGEVKTPPFSKEARIETGYLLRRLQQGELLSLPWSRPMPSIGPRCHELRVTDAKSNWRIFYRIDRDALIIVDVAQKKTRQTPQLVIDTCKRRLRLFDQDEENAMNKNKRKKLESKGWRVGTVQEFLSLSPEESAYIELKLALAKNLKKRRRALHLTQIALARRLKSSQSRIAKMESGDPTVSVDLLVRSLLALGTPKQTLRRTLPT